MVVKAYKELLVWQKGMILVSQIYSATTVFPKSETYGLTDQMRRAAVSVPSNIAEGFGRRSRPEMSRFALIAQGSLYELETQVIIAGNLGYLAPDKSEALDSLITELSVMLQSFVYNLRHPKATKTKIKPS